MAKKVIFGITLTWKKVVGIILGLLGIGTLTSCYGMPMTDYMVVSGTVVGDIDGDGENEPVPGIRVSLNKEEIRTDEDGAFEIIVCEHEDGSNNAALSFIDEDGPENGDFEDKVERFPYEPYGYEDITFVLSKK